MSDRWWLLPWTRGIVGVWKTVALILARPRMKTTEVLFHGDFKERGVSKRLGVLYPDLVCAYPGLSQVRRERDLEHPFGIRGTNFGTLRRYFHRIGETLARSRPK